MKLKPKTPCWGNRPFVEYMCEVDRLLHAQYGITVDDLDAVAAAQEAGDSPQSHVEWLAEHYDLAPLPRAGGGEATRQEA
jgi:hypothetical protein